jgi:hypothetical protein
MGSGEWAGVGGDRAGVGSTEDVEEGVMRGIEAAIREREWEVAALYLVLGVIRVAARLPPGSAADLLDLLATERRDGGT